MKIVLIDYTKVFNDLILFEKFNYTFTNEKINLIYGDNGCGKSSLFLSILGIDKSYKGKINLINIKNITYFSPNVSLIKKTTLKENIDYFFKKKENILN